MLFCGKSTFDVEETLINNYERETIGEGGKLSKTTFKGCGPAWSLSNFTLTGDHQFGGFAAPMSDDVTISCI